MTDHPPGDPPVAEVLDLFPAEPPRAVVGAVREMVQKGNTDMTLIGSFTPSAPVS